MKFNIALSNLFKYLHNWIFNLVMLLAAMATIAVFVVEYYNPCYFFNCSTQLDTPNKVVETARRYFDQKSMDLRVQINSSTDTVYLNEDMYLSLTNNSDIDGYFLILNIDAVDSSIFSFLPIELELKEFQRYLFLKQGNELVIPQPKVPEDPFSDIKVLKPVGEKLLIVVLVNKIPLKILKILLPTTTVSSSQNNSLEILRDLHTALITPKNKIGNKESLEWRSVVMRYQVVSKLR